MTHTQMNKAVWALLLTTSVMICRPAGAEPVAMVLTLELSSAIYQPAEPIVVLVTVTNEGQEDFEDLAYLDPSAGHLVLSLSGPNGVVPDLGAADMIVYGHRGPTLRPQESRCTVLNVLRRFGERSQGRYGLPVGNQYALLPPGKYQLSAKLRARLGFVKGLPEAVLESDDVAFEIVERRDVAAANGPLLEMIGRRGQLEARRARAMQMVRGAGWRHLYPGYILLAVQSGLSDPSGMPTDALAANPNAYGFSTLQGVAVLYHRVGSLGGSLEEKQRVVAQLEGRAHSPMVKCVLRTLRQLFADRAIDLGEQR